jgi:hypothetical protein
MKNTSILMLSLVILASAFYIVSNREVLAGSVGAGYAYRHITSADASSTAGVVVKGGFGELGTLTINSATATSKVIIYDGATTATSGLSVIASIGATQAGGSYTYEVSVNKGVVVEVPSTFTGDLTFSVR